MIEARGIGILQAPTVLLAPLHLVVDLGKQETKRLPEQHNYDILGRTVPLLYSTGEPVFAAALAHYLSFGRKA
jgi:HPr kinase/phosphorylase